MRGVDRNLRPFSIGSVVVEVVAIVNALRVSLSLGTARDICRDERGFFPGKYTIVEVSSMLYLGEEVLVVVCGVRLVAMDTFFYV